MSWGGTHVVLVLRGGVRVFWVRRQSACTFFLVLHQWEASDGLSEPIDAGCGTPDGGRTGLFMNYELRNLMNDFD